VTEVTEVASEQLRDFSVEPPRILELNAEQLA
jgi:hypothetical protein